MLCRQLGAGSNHILGQTHRHRQGTNGDVGDVEFPPAMAVGGAALIGVVIVVPPFTIADQADEPVVAAVLVGFVIPIAPHVRHRIDAPGDMPDRHGSDEDAQTSMLSPNCKPAAGAPSNQPASKPAPKNTTHWTAYTHNQFSVSLHSHIKRISQQFPGISLVVPTSVEVAILDQQPAHVPPEEVTSGLCGSGCSSEY